MAVRYLDDWTAVCDCCSLTWDGNAQHICSGCEYGCEHCGADRSPPPSPPAAGGEEGEAPPPAAGGEGEAPPPVAGGEGEAPPPAATPPAPAARPRASPPVTSPRAAGGAPAPLIVTLAWGRRSLVLQGSGGGDALADEVAEAVRAVLAARAPKRRRLGGAAAAQ